MARVLLTWELGAGTGHLHNLGAVGTALAARGDEVLVAAREPAAATAVFGQDGLRFVQAPSWTGSVRGMPPAANYAELLLRVGYGHAGVLRGLLSAWLELFRLYRPDWLLAEHAPTALLAARLAGLPAAHLGSGFMVPPQSDPMPSLQPWTNFPGERLASAERAVIAAVDEAIAPLGGIGPPSVADLMTTRADYLCTFEELDHYGRREPDTRYWGAMQAHRSLPAPRWPAGDGPKLFGYMNAGLDHFDGVLRALGELGLPTLVVAHGLHPSRAQAYTTPSLHVQAEPVDLAGVARDAALSFGHGGHGTVAELLRHGLAMLILPQFLEHAVLAFRVSHAGLALVPKDGHGPQPDMRAAVHAMLGRGDIAERARGFAERYRAHDSAASVTALTEDLVARMSDRG